MRRLVLSCCLAFAALLAHAEVIDIDNAELARLISSGTPLIDIRTRPEWEESGIIEGSRLLTFYDENGRADAAGWLDKIKPLAKPNEALIVICRSGNRTRAVSQFLSQQAGYAKVYNVKKGIKGWLGEGRPVSPAAAAIASCRTAKTC